MPKDEEVDPNELIPEWLTDQSVANSNDEWKYEIYSVDLRVRGAYNFTAQPMLIGQQDAFLGTKIAV